MGLFDIGAGSSRVLIAEAWLTKWEIGMRLTDKILVFINVLGLVFLTANAQACGFHDPKSVQRGAMNFFYPESLHVSGKIWQLQQDGQLPMPDIERITARGETRKRLETQVFWQLASLLQSIATRMAQSTSDNHDISLVLLSSMLWTHYKPHSTDPFDQFMLDTGSARNGDLVVVTDEEIIFAISRGEMTLKQAVEIEAMRLYGDSAQISNFLTDFGSIGQLPLKPDQAALMKLVFKRPNPSEISAAPLQDKNE